MTADWHTMNDVKCCCLGGFSMGCMACLGCKRSEVIMSRLNRNQMNTVIEDIVIPYLGRELFAFENETNDKIDP